MRKIRFRAWDKEEKWMVDDLYISFSGDIFTDDVDSHDTPYKETELANAERYELMQFTGERDKNGTEIYEGDIVSYEGVNYTIVFEAAGFNADGFYDASQDAPWDYFSEGANERSEVVGNVYENQELIGLVNRRCPNDHSRRTKQMDR